jgi:hypothetical protein
MKSLRRDSEAEFGTDDLSKFRDRWRTSLFVLLDNVLHEGVKLSFIEEWWSAHDGGQLQLII